MPNRTTPEFWKDDLRLNSLSRDAELLFRKLHHLVEDNHRFLITPSPQQPKNIWASLYYLREGVRLTDVARWLDEIQKAGAILVKDSDRGWYGEIVENLRYRAEDYAKGAPRYGPRLEKPADQEHLPLGPMGLVKPAPMPAKKSKPYESEYDNGNGNDSAPPPKETRALSSGKESPERFARGNEDCRDEVWKDLCKAVGLSEMTKNGALWLTRIKLARRAVAMSCADYLALGPDQRAAVTNRGAWMTSRFEHYRPAA